MDLTSEASKRPVAAGFPALSSGLPEAIDSAILLLAEDGTILQSNHYAAEMLGYANGRLSGKSVSRLFPQTSRFPT
jgi:PAS domain-containing protein